MEFSHERDLKDTHTHTQTKHDEKIHQSVGCCISCSFRSAESTVSFVSLSFSLSFYFSPFFVLTFISLKGECITHRVTQSSAKVFKRLKDEGEKTLLFVVIERFVFSFFFRPVETGFFFSIQSQHGHSDVVDEKKSEIIWPTHLFLSDGHG